MPSRKPTKSDIVDPSEQIKVELTPAMIPTSQLNPMHVADLQLPTNPEAAPLTDNEVKAAREAGMINKTLVNEQFNDFRKMRQSRTYQEVDGQRFAVLTWVPSTKASPDSDNTFGLMRIGGCFGTQAEADKHAEKLLRKDSTREFLVTYVGLDFPLTSDDFGVLRTDKIDLKTKVEDIERQNERKLEELEEQKVREIEEAHENLLSDVTRKRTPDDIDTYIELCVKQAHSEAERCKAIEQIERCNRVVVATQPLLEQIIANHPEYKQDAAKSYASACTRVGIDPKQSAVAAFLDFDRIQEHKTIPAPGSVLDSPTSSTPSE